jgi:hypothetical protein
MGHWRLRSVWWTLGLGVVVVVALGLGVPPQAAAQNPCEGFTGVCRGQCDAALDQGCFENPDTRQCGKREEQWEFHACPGTPPWAPVKRVFVTSTSYTGNLGGLAGADAKCQERATAAGLGGTFKAWLSAAGTGNSAGERLTPAPGPYVRTDGIQVARDFSDLVDGSIAAPIPLNEFGVASGQLGAWTGTMATGEASGFNCNGWTSAAQADVGDFGNQLATDTTWTILPMPLSCDLFRKLYCIEQ